MRRLRVLKNNNRALDEDWVKGWVAGSSVLVGKLLKVENGSRRGRYEDVGRGEVVKMQ